MIEIKKKKICVFCSARDKLKTVFKESAEKCGELIGKKGFDLVYGGSSRGMMGITAKAASDNGAKVIGFFPTPLSPLDKDLYHSNGDENIPEDQYETLNTNMDETIFVNNMFERNERMFSISDIFITLAGGFGTIDEFFEVFTIKNLGWHHKEIILVNTDGYWDEMIAMINKSVDMNFASKNSNKLFQIVNTVEEAFEYIAKLNI